jgi:hypothetical protein
VWGLCPWPSWELSRDSWGAHTTDRRSGHRLEASLSRPTTYRCWHLQSQHTCAAIAAACLYKAQSVHASFQAHPCHPASNNPNRHRHCCDITHIHCLSIPALESTIWKAPYPPYPLEPSCACMPRPPCTGHVARACAKQRCQQQRRRDAWGVRQTGEAVGGAPCAAGVPKRETAPGGQTPTTTNALLRARNDGQHRQAFCQ